MAYPEICFQNLLGIKGTCEPQEAEFWLDDVPGMDLGKLADTSEANSAPTGALLAAKLIESAARIMAADVEAIYDGNYKVQNTLVNGCSACSWLTNYAQGNQRGILIKDNTESAFSHLLLDKLTVKVNSTGTFHVVIDDGDGANLRIIENEFIAGYEYDLVNLKYTTKRKSVKVYMQEDNVPMAQLSCPRNGGCGCSGGAAVVADLVYTGLSNGVESQAAYGFKPCAVITCDAADLLCFVAHSAPRMIGMALLYKTAELYFQTRLQSSRNNKTVGSFTDETKDDAARYGKLYTAKLNGTGSRGVKDLVYTTLQQTSDPCVICNSLIATGWAAG